MDVVNSLLDRYFILLHKKLYDKNTNMVTHILLLLANDDPNRGKRVWWLTCIKIKIRTASNTFSTGI